MLSSPDDAANLQAFHDSANVKFRSQGDQSDCLVRQVSASRAGRLCHAIVQPCPCGSHGVGVSWGLVRRGSKIIARSAIRFVVTDDLIRDELASMRLWQNRPGPLERLKSLVATPRLPTINGRTCHEGCTWVAAPHRRQGIAARLVGTMRALALLKWEPNWIFGFLRPEVHESGVAERTYGYRNLALILSGYLPVTRRDVTVYLSYMTSREAALVMRTQRTN